MKPKEKATELVEKMAIYHWTNVCDYEGAKQCALIEVDEILDMLIGSTATIDYWKEVKEEIIKL